MEATNNFLIALARSSLEAGILVVLVLIAQWVFQKQLAARWRCALWLLVVARLLLPFSFSSVTSVFNLLPRWTPSVPAVSAPAPAPLPAAAEPLAKPSSTTASPPEPLPPIPTADEHKPSWSWPDTVFAIWLAGVLLLAGYVFFSFLKLCRRCAGLTPVDEVAVLNVLDECCARLRTRSKPALLESDQITSPALHGLLRPRLLLPQGFASKFSLLELRFVFLHELAHLKRRDLLVNWVMTVVQVLHWFNPLVWLAFARWRADRELACDAMALEAAGRIHNKDYGRTILRLLESFTHPKNTPGLVGILEDKSQLHRRIRMIASYVPARGWPRLAFALIGALAVIGLTDAQTPVTDISTSAHGADTSPGAVETSPLADELIGAWIKVGTPGHVHEAPAAGGRYKFFTGSRWCMTQADAKTGVVIFHHGGTYQFKGDEYDESVEYANPSTMYNIGNTGKFSIQIKGDILTDIGISNRWREVWKRLKPDAATADSPLERELTGTWVCVKSGEVPGDGAPPGQDFKLCVDGHFCNTYADPNNGVVVEHHGGTYTLDGDTYSETVDYANPDRMNLIGHTFKFKIEFEGDTMKLTGIGNPWKEVWKRAN